MVQVSRNGRIQVMEIVDSRIREIREEEEEIEMRIEIVGREITEREMIRVRRMKRILMKMIKERILEKIEKEMGGMLIEGKIGIIKEVIVVGIRKEKTRILIIRERKEEKSREIVGVRSEGGVMIVVARARVGVGAVVAWAGIGIRMLVKLKEGRIEEIEIPLMKGIKGKLRESKRVELIETETGEKGVSLAKKIREKKISKVEEKLNSNNRRI